MTTARARGEDAPDGVPVTGGAPARPWTLGAGLVWGLGAGIAVVVVGVLLGRPDVAVLGAGPALAGIAARRTRPVGDVWVDVVRTVDGEIAELEALLGDGAAPREARLGPDGTLTAQVRLTAPPGTDAVRLRVRRPHHGPVEALVDVPLTRTLDVSASSVRTGPQDLFGVEHQGLAGGAELTGPVGSAPPDRVLVLPTPRSMPALPLPARLRGLSGQHASRRPGDGGALRDVHPMQPGDSTRRIDWRVTARRSPGLDQLYVRRTLALAEAVVTLVVDSRDDVGPDASTWNGVRPVRPDDATSLDLARQAAATVAEGYLAVGDRVGVEDLGVRRRAVRAGTGRRQLDRVLHQLALLRPEGDPAPRVRPPQVPAGSLVYLFSTFLDPEAADLALGWRRAGHRVVAVDVLPRLRLTALSSRERLALRIVRMERGDLLDDLEAAGVEVVRWADGPAATRRLLQGARANRRRPGRAG